MSTGRAIIVRYSCGGLLINGNEDVVFLLLGAGKVDVNSKYEEGLTPLPCAW
jgi:hypothetical protein